MHTFILNGLPSLRYQNYNYIVTYTHAHINIYIWVFYVYMNKYVYIPNFLGSDLESLLMDLGPSAIRSASWKRY